MARANRLFFKAYSLDAHGATGRGARPGPAVSAFARLTRDERWALPDVPELIGRSLAIWEETFASVREDLAALPSGRTIVGEGPGAFPWLAAPLLTSPRQAIFLVPRFSRSTSAPTCRRR